jgi:DNA-binding NtrC family response regulator
MITTLLLVDPQQLLQFYYVETLQKNGFRVQHATTPSHARQLVQSQTRVDMGIADLRHESDPSLALRDLSVIQRKYGIPLLILTEPASTAQAVCVQLGLPTLSETVTLEALQGWLHDTLARQLAARLQIKDPHETKPATRRENAPS